MDRVRGHVLDQLAEKGQINFELEFGGVDSEKKVTGRDVVSTLEKDGAPKAIVDMVKNNLEMDSLE